MDVKQKPDLSNYTEEEILVTLVERNALFVCQCGCCYEDELLYDLHRASHAAFEPLMCDRCGHVSDNYADFNKHFSCRSARTANTSS